MSKEIKKYYKWIKGDDFGVKEMWTGKKDCDIMIFESKNRVAENMISDYLLEITEEEYNEDKTNVVEITHTNETIHPICKNHKKDLDFKKLNQVIELSDSTNIQFDMKLPDKKTVLIMQLSDFAIEDAIINLNKKRLEDFLIQKFQELYENKEN